MTTIGGICIRDVVFTTRDTTVAAAAKLMRENHVGSIVVVEQMNGNWRVKGGAYVRVYRRLRELLTEVEFQVRWRWVPRERNQVADDLSKRALTDAGVRIAERRKA